MGRILLSICAVVVAVALGGAAQPQQQVSATSQAVKATEKTRQQRPPVLVTLGEPAREGGSDDERADPARGGADPSPWYDLTAQSLMALFALGQVVLTGIGIFYIRDTLKATKAAVVEASKATKAAEDVLEDGRAAAAAEATRFASQLEIAKSSAEAAKTQADVAMLAQRPWLRLELRKLRVNFWDDSPHIGMEVEVELAMENVGKQPTKLEWMPEFRVGFMQRHALGAGGLSNQLQESVQFHYPGNVLTNHFPIFPGETQVFPGHPTSGEPFPLSVLHDPETGITEHWNPEPGYTIYLLAGVRHTIPGGEGRSRCFYRIENEDGSPVMPGTTKPYGWRDDLKLVRIDGLSHIE